MDTEGYGNPGDEGYFAEYTAYYLEAAPVNISGDQMWAYDDNYVAFIDLIPGLSHWDQTDWGIGRGRMNTSIIIARGIAMGYKTPAASACRTLTTGDKTDWFLPSKDELFAMYWGMVKLNEMYADILPSGLFWSSSQQNITRAWYLFFSQHGIWYDTDKYSLLNVRPVRAF